MQVTPTRRTLAGVVAAVAALASVTTLATGASAAPACPDVELVFARGTGEAAGLGIVGRPLERALAAELPGRTVVATAVDYAASSSQASAGPGSGDMVAKVRSRAAACPGTQFVLGGYSQGATVTDLALGIRTGVTAGTALPEDLAARVAAVVVYGNPLGLTRRTIAQAAPAFATRTVEYCNAGDPVCEPGGGRFTAHITYATNGTVLEGARFAAARVTAPAPTPTPGPTGTPAPVPSAEPTPAPGDTCVTASSLQHVRDGRAYPLWMRTYARGSGDPLGVLSSRTVVSLQADGTDTWRKVAAC
ncbi:cutinase [Cellulomonas flavigena DSM 20109]|uniref:Cutinase n=1 Tax=Cellulomonas flavigena (strain ATCC 482 / DSM 20109 / BCRC 11376 / JCM 18109 / NBRC 3775 / NCIMB 8073 / NRS 134) TaxID=446466 RepID=D5ULP3_CELFN|nr:cutinase family protein [Cellulomonas flavigena]ADG75999.1 cutinase [Cellulomonas flavigena DSM 20109]